MITFAFTIVFLFVLCARFVYLVMVYFFFWQICFFVCVVIQQIPWNGKHIFTSLHRLSLLRKRVSSSSLYEMNWRNSYVLSFRGGGVGEGVPMGQFQFSDENNPGLHSFCDWSRKRAPFSQPIGCKPKTDHDLIFRVFPHSRHYGWVIVVFQCLCWLR